MVYFLLLLLGMAFGSFINALIWRTYVHGFADSKIMNKLKSKKIGKNDLSLLHGRSMCTHCQHKLSWTDLLPVLSWLGLGGKCRYCNKKISWQYPAVELAMAGLFVASYIYWPYGLGASGVVMFGLWLATLVILAALFVFDVRWMLLPDRLIAPLIVTSGFIAIVRILYSSNLPVTTLNTLVSVAIAGGLFHVLFVLSKGKLIGGGDGKLGVGLGLLLGSPILAMLMLFIASLLGTFYALPGYIKNKKNSRVPFGPFLITATLFCFFFGSEISDWYMRSLGL